MDQYITIKKAPFKSSVYNLKLYAINTYVGYNIPYYYLGQSNNFYGDFYYN